MKLLPLVFVFSITIACADPTSPPTSTQTLIAQFLQVRYQVTPEAVKVTNLFLDQVPIDDTKSSGDLLGIWMTALETLKLNSALDDYETRLQQNYQKGAISRFVYDEELSLSYLAHKPTAATPLLEDAYQQNPDNGLVAGCLAVRYETEKNDAKLLPLLDFILIKNLLLPAQKKVDVVAAYIRTKQLSHLIQLFDGIIANSKTDNVIVAGDEFFLSHLQDGVNSSGTPADQIAFYRSLTELDHGWPLYQKKMILLLQKQGDQQGVGDECLALLFPKQTGADRDRAEWGFQPPVQTQHFISAYCWERDLIRIAKAAGQIERLKTAAKALLDSDPIIYSKIKQMAILVYAHDPEALTKIPDFLKQMEFEGKNPNGGLLAMQLFVMLQELKRWPEASDYLKPTLHSAYTLYQANLETMPYMRVLEAPEIAQDAITLGDTDFAKQILGESLAQIVSPPANSPLPDPNDLCANGKCLIELKMEPEAQKLVAALADPKLTDPTQNSRATAIAQLGTTALEEGLPDTARFAALQAMEVLTAIWHPLAGQEAPRACDAKTIQLLGKLLVRLELPDQLNKLREMLGENVPITAAMDLAKVKADLDANEATFSTKDLPHLTPVIWAMTNEDGSRQSTAWDLTGTAFQDDLDDLPSPKTTYKLQILAGPQSDDMRVVKEIPTASECGQADVPLKSDDRYIQGIFQSTEAEPHLFISKPGSITQGTTFLPEDLVPHIKTNEHATEDEEPLMTNGSLPVMETTLSSGAKYETITCPEGYQSLELKGPSIPLKSGSSYMESVWIKGDVQYGIEFLDAHGKVLLKKLKDFQTAGNWALLTLTFSLTIDNKVDFMAPEGTVSVVPLLTGKEITFANLSIGSDSD